MRDVLAGAALSPQRNDPLEIGWSVALGCAWVVTSGQPCRPGPRLDSADPTRPHNSTPPGLGTAAACDRLRHFLSTSGVDRHPYGLHSTSGESDALSRKRSAARRCARVEGGRSNARGGDVQLIGALVIKVRQCPEIASADMSLLACPPTAGCACLRSSARAAGWFSPSSWRPPV